MSDDVRKRSNNQCELCESKADLLVLEVGPDRNDPALLCDTCRLQYEAPELIEPNRWRCLSKSMWSEFPAVQVLAWRMLRNLSTEAWARELLDQLYLDDETLAWAKAGALAQENTQTVITKDSNGTVLSEGDSVTLIKDLDVKGANFTAKRGTLVKNIRLIDDPENIEGKINSSVIVLKTMFLKKV